MEKGRENTKTTFFSLSFSFPGNLALRLPFPFRLLFLPLPPEDEEEGGGAFFSGLAPCINQEGKRRRRKRGAKRRRRDGRKEGKARAGRRDISDSLPPFFCHFDLSLPASP